jgi:hypothetical protein
MASFEMAKLAFMSCIEVVIMRRGYTKFNLVQCKLRTLHNVEILDCFDHPEYLRTVFKEVYKEEYPSVLDEIRLELEKLEDIKEMEKRFFNVMES